MITTDPELIAQAARLRAEVFTGEQGVDPAIEADGADAGAVHSVVVRDGAVLATGRLVEEPEPEPEPDPEPGSEAEAGGAPGSARPGGAGRLGRIATARQARGSGLGALVVADLVAAAARSGLPRLRLHAQSPVVGFYLRLGWEVAGPPDVEAGIEHRWMTRDLLPGARAVRDEDAADIQALIGGCFAEYPGCVLELEALDAWMLAPAAGFRAKGGELWVLPAPGGGLAASGGWAPVAPDTGSADAAPARARAVELKSLYTTAAHRGRGLGSALVGVVLRRAAALGAEQVELGSDTRFTDAHRLYERLGFVRRTQTRALHDISQSIEYLYDRPALPLLR